MISSVTGFSTIAWRIVQCSKLVISGWSLSAFYAGERHPPGTKDPGSTETSENRCNQHQNLQGRNSGLVVQQSLTQKELLKREALGDRAGRWVRRGPEGIEGFYRCKWAKLSNLSKPRHVATQQNDPTLQARTRL